MHVQERFLHTPPMGKVCFRLWKIWLAFIGICVSWQKFGGCWPNICKCEGMSRPGMLQARSFGKSLMDGERMWTICWSESGLGLMRLSIPGIYIPYSTCDRRVFYKGYLVDLKGHCTREIKQQERHKNIKRNQNKNMWKNNREQGRAQHDSKLVKGTICWE